MCVEQRRKHAGLAGSVYRKPLYVFRYELWSLSTAASLVPLAQRAFGLRAGTLNRWASKATLGPRITPSTCFISCFSDRRDRKCVAMVANTPSSRTTNLRQWYGCFPNQANYNGWLRFLFLSTTMWALWHRELGKNIPALIGKGNREITLRKDVPNRPAIRAAMMSQFRDGASELIACCIIGANVWAAFGNFDSQGDFRSCGNHCFDS